MKEVKKESFYKKTNFWIVVCAFLLIVLVFVIRFFVVAYTSVPKIELIGEAEIMIDLNEEYKDPGVKASLNNKDVSDKVEIEGKVNTKKAGNYKIIYSIENDRNQKRRSVSRTVIVLDNIKPAITLKGSAEYFVGLDSEYKDPGYISIDNVDGDITKKVKVESDVNTKELGSYQVNYTVEDSSGNKAEAIRIVRVVDLTKPTLTLKGDSTIRLKLNQKYTEPGYTATDNVDGNLTEDVKVTGTVNSSVVGVYILKYTVKDKMNNEITKSRTVYVGNQADQDRTTYISISISQQKLWYYKNNALIISSNIVTGHKNKHDTPKGTFRIRSKTRNTYLTGVDYRSFVYYWMPIYGQVGLHDATWRSSFGGNIYTYNGSHGCINLPFNVAKTIFETAPIGTKVTVY